MRMQQNMTHIEYAQKLDKMEKEISKMRRDAVAPKMNISLYGILKGIRISGKEIDAAKRSLFKKGAR